MEGGYVAYVHRHRNAALQVIGPKRSFPGGNEVYDEGVTVYFKDRIAVVNDPKIIKALDGHHKYGVTFARVENARQLEQLKRHAAAQVRFARGPATTASEKLGAPKPVGPDMTPISKIAPGNRPDDAPPPPPKRGKK